MILKVLSISLLIVNTSFADINPICNEPPEPVKQKYDSVAKETKDKPGLRVNEIKALDSVFNSGEFLFFKGDGPFSTYATLNTDFTSAEYIFNQVKELNYENLQNRGEAHITVLSPVEYFCIFGPQNIYNAPAVSMDQIQNVVEKFLKGKFKNNTTSRIAFALEGIGSGQKVIFDPKINKLKLAETFFLITPSDDLVTIRKEIRKLLKGVAYEAFVPENFYPHITIGFTDTDLHESDGVRKNAEYSLDPRFKIVSKQE